MKMNDFWGDDTDIPAMKEALQAMPSVIVTSPWNSIFCFGLEPIYRIEETEEWFDLILRNNSDDKRNSTTACDLELRELGGEWREAVGLCATRCTKRKLAFRQEPMHTAHTCRWKYIEKWLYKYKQKTKLRRMNS